MKKSIKLFIQETKKNRRLLSHLTSIIFALIMLVIFNLEPPEKSMIEIDMFWPKNIMLGVLMYMSFFVMIQSDLIIERYKEAINERDDYIEHLKDLLVEQVEKQNDNGQK